MSDPTKSPRPTLAQLRANVSAVAGKQLDWIWEFYLNQNEWPTDRRIYRETLKRDFDAVLATLNGSYIQEVEQQGSKFYQVMPLGILCTTRGKHYEILLRKYIGYLRDIYFNHDKQNSVKHDEVQSALGLPPPETALLGRLLHVGLLSSHPGYMPDFSTWSAPLPAGLGDILPQHGSIDEAFEVLIRRHWHPQLKVMAYERAQALQGMTYAFDYGLGMIGSAATKKKPAKREKISQLVATKVITESRRRCALCFGLQGDLGVKEGQIAHIDRNAGNSKPANLAWLCLEHHAKYDATSNRNRGFTPAELRKYRSELWAAIKGHRHERAASDATPAPTTPVSPFEADITASPQGAVLKAWQLVERYALGALQTKISVANPTDMPGGVRSRLLRDFAGVDQLHADLHDQLGPIRDAIAHGAPVDEAGARAFCEKAAELIRYLATK